MHSGSGKWGSAAIHSQLVNTWTLLVSFPPHSLFDVSDVGRDNLYQDADRHAPIENPLPKLAVFGFILEHHTDDGEPDRDQDN